MKMKSMKLTEAEKHELFMARHTRRKYTKEERIQFFVEKKYRVPTPVKNKKKYNRKTLKRSKLDF